MDMWVNCDSEVSYILIDKDNINLISKNAEIKVDGYIEQEGRND